MSPKTRQNQRESIEQEDRILLVVSALKNQEIRSIREAARIYNIYKRTLRRQFNRIIFRSETHANNYKLTQNKENLLVQ